MLLPFVLLTLSTASTARGSQQPRQKPVVTEAHATLTKLVKLPELVCLSDSPVSVMFISDVVVVQTCPWDRSLSFSTFTTAVFDDVGFACCLTKALSPLHMLQPLLQLVLGHSKMCADVPTCSVVGLLVFII